MKHKYYIIILGIALCFAACKKFANEAFNNTTTQKETLAVKVINDDDQLPVAGVKVIISRQTEASGVYTQVDTIRTDKDGQISTKLPYPNNIKVEVDTTYYHKGEQALYFNSAANVVLHTTPKYGMAPLNIAVKDELNAGISNFPMLIDTKAPGADTYTSTGGLEHAGTNGQLIVSLPYPNAVRVIVGDTMKYFPDTLKTALKNVRGETVNLTAKLKPTTVPLEVTVLDKDNSTLLPGIDIVVLQKLTGETDFKAIGLTGTTGSNGKLILNAPYEGEVKIKTTDPAFFSPDSAITRMAYAQNRSITLRSKKLTPKAPVDVLVYDQSNNQILPGVTVNVSSKITGETAFKLDTTAVTDENGKLSVRVRFSGDMKFEVLNDTYFASNAITATNTGSAAKQVSLPLTVKTAAYPEPVLTTLMVSSLTLNNGITLNAPTDVANDKRGNIYICDQNNNRIIRVSRNGNTTVLAGSATASSVDGTGTAATFNKPKGMVINQAGTELYVTEYSGNKVRKITINPTNMTAVVTTIAGSGAAGTADAVGTAATFTNPSGIDLDEAGGALYLSDLSASTSVGRIRKIALSTNTVSTLGTATIYAPNAIALNPSKTSLYLGSFGNTFGSTESYLFRVTVSSGARTVLKQTKTTNFNDPSGIFISPAGVIFVCSEKAHSIARVTSEVTTNSIFGLLAGSGTDDSITGVNAVTGTAGNVDGPAAIARFNLPWAIKYNAHAGSFLIADQGNNKIRIMKSSTIN
ncbi:hypothetical protein G7074_08955 [Pedobacter sp. HDW13]|uniref:hypothetical protein n=1 Tax=unclassified Pedobacter TaxID=2628915 RepID=UPI000F593C6C|nr:MULTISPECIES: hypothetical protein [unclassified Pedobacter]QIL39392.1 hypothetical protein G7074_08955 [Pedobacter sp. HDW13]RQO71035.1 hypothetical protein DBR40_17510 [Pedobacter sp. KBW01]